MTPKSGLELLSAEAAACQYCALSSETRFSAAGSAPAEIAYVVPKPLLEESAEAAMLAGALDKLGRTWWVSALTKCFSRQPNPSELIECSAYFRTELLYVQPKLIIGFGRDVAVGLELHAGPGWRGRIQSFENIPTVVTYPLDYLANKATGVEKKRSSKDLLRAVALVFGS